MEIRGTEIWLVGNGLPRRLTHDGKSKDLPVLSSSKKRIAYIEQCFGECAPSVVVLDSEGRRILSFQPRHGAASLNEPCASILSIAWVGDNALAAECHINPSLSEYIETNISTGTTTRDLLGFEFTPSPNGKWVAHVGSIMHFAPPYAKSYYLQVDHTTLYPLPAGMKPVEQTGSAQAPKVVRKEGPTYKGIHEFGDISWSPDSHQIALIDCTYDWTPNTPESLAEADGKESGRRWALVVVSKTGKFVTFPLNETNSRDLGEARITWNNPHELSVELNGKAKTFRLP